MAKTRCDICDRSFKNEEGLAMHNQAKHSSSSPKPTNPLPMKKMRNWTIGIVIIVLLIWGIIAIWPDGASGGGLPPTTMQGHIEVSPASHILKSPMRLEVHKHMLEHADGADGGAPGIIINYDCENHSCSPDLIQKLEAFADKYPLNVYVAPFRNMPVKIALTRLGRIETLDEYNEATIDSFIIGFG